MTTLNDYCRREFGKKLYKLSLDAGFTCPTRDGTLGTRGCTFCSAAGSGEFTGRGKTVDAQIEDAKRRVAAKCRGDVGYIAYFQSFTNTYAPADRLRDIYLPVIRRSDISVLSIATRPDCLPPDTLDLLAELNGIKPVWVELGLQTTKPESVEYIRRGYENEVYAEAVKALRARRIYVITHIILGLPGETPAEMEETLRYALAAGTDGVKFQLLHVLEGTDLAEDWRAGKFRTLTMEEYTDILARLVSLLPPDVAAHRLTGDGSKKDLLSPLWSGEKKKVLNAIRARLSVEN
jgi:radical SAM protein (TIGR01212 family)